MFCTNYNRLICRKKSSRLMRRTKYFLSCVKHGLKCLPKTQIEGILWGSRIRVNFPSSIKRVVLPEKVDFLDSFQIALETHENLFACGISSHRVQNSWILSRKSFKKRIVLCKFSLLTRLNLPEKFLCSAP